LGLSVEKRVEKFILSKLPFICWFLIFFPWQSTISLLEKPQTLLLILWETHHSLMFQTPNKCVPEASVVSKRQICLPWKLLESEKKNNHEAYFNVD
jgi:hypothetical protein